jgi:hypothetical protein
MDLLYYLSIPVVNAFNISTVLIDPLIVALLAFLLYGALAKLAPFPIGKTDQLIAAFLGCAVLSSCVNANWLNGKSVNHLMAVFACYTMFYVVPVRLSGRLSIERILSMLWIGYVVTTVFGLLEFALVNFAGKDLTGIVFRPSVTDYTPGFLDIVLIRSRSFFEESGYYAAYLALIAPLLYFYLWEMKKSKAAKWAFVVLSLTSYFISFSVSLFIFLPMAAAMPNMIRMVTERRVTPRMILAMLIIAGLAATALSSDVVTDLLFSRKAASFNDRNDKFEATLELMARANPLHALFGYGPGSYAALHVDPAISVYLNFWRDYGALGIGVYLILTIQFLMVCARDKSKFGTAVFTSAIAIALFFIATPLYFLPAYFIPLVLHKLKFARIASDESRVDNVQAGAVQ